MDNLTFQQKLAMVIGFVGAGTSAFGALAPILTSTQTLVGTVILGFISGCLGVVLTVTTGAKSQLQTINMVAPNQLAKAIGQVAPDQLVRAAMMLPGVSSVHINQNATPDLAAVALDPTALKVTALPQDAAAVSALAEQGGKS